MFAFAFLDCEFGGLDPELHDITEIGVIVTDYRLRELSEGEWKVRPRPERVSQEAARREGRWCSQRESNPCLSLERAPS